MVLKFTLPAFNLIKGVSSIEYSNAKMFQSVPSFLVFMIYLLHQNDSRLSR